MKYRHLSKCLLISIEKKKKNYASSDVCMNLELKIEIFLLHIVVIVGIGGLSIDAFEKELRLGRDMN